MLQSLPMSALSRLPLLICLVFAATGELLLHRMASRLLLPASGSPTVLHQALEQSGLFFGYFSGLLALGLFTWSTLVLIRDAGLLSLPQRLVLALLSAFFLPLSAMGIVLHIPSSMQAHLNIAFSLMLAALATLAVRRNGPLRARLGVLYLALPLLLHGLWRASQQIPALAPGGELSELPARLFEAGEYLTVLGGFALFLFFAPLPRPGSAWNLSPLPMAVALSVTTLAALFTRAHFAVAAQLVYDGFGFNLPPPSVQALFHLAALFFLVFTLTALALRSATCAALALGLLLVVLAGFHLQTPGQLLLILVGLHQVMRATSLLGDQPDPSPDQEAVSRLTSEHWSTYLSRVAQACSTRVPGEVVMLHNEDQRIVQARGQRNGLPFVMRLHLRPDLVEQLEIIVGEPGREPAPLTLNRRHGLRGHRIWTRDSGRRLHLGDAAFDPLFVVRERGDGGRELLASSALLSALSQQVHGWLGLWPAEGLRYVHRPERDAWPFPVAEMAFSAEAADTLPLERLVGLLLDLAGQTAAAPASIPAAHLSH